MRRKYNHYTEKDVVSWSGNCISQNKNRMIVFIYVFLDSLTLLNVGILSVVMASFIATGNSPWIEKRKRKCVPMGLEDLHDVILHTG